MSEIKTTEKNDLCSCGCGKEVIRPGARYFGMGHDSKHKAKLAKAVVEGTTAQRNRAKTEIEGLSDRLRQQVEATIELRLSRITAKQEKARQRQADKEAAAEAKAAAKVKETEPEAKVQSDGSTEPKPKARRTRKAS